MFSTASQQEGGRPGGPENRPVTHADLPCVKIRRWLPGHKVQVVRAVNAGLISHEEACRRYGLNPEELSSWQALAAVGGLDGLRLSGRRAVRRRA